MQKLVIASLALLILTGCGATRPLTAVAPAGAAPAARATAACRGTQLYGSYGTFRIAAVIARNTQTPGSPTVTVALEATPDSKAQGHFKAIAYNDGSTSPNQLSAGTVINAFVNYTCVQTGTSEILPKATPYQLGQVSIVTRR